MAHGVGSVHAMHSHNVMPMYFDHVCLFTLLFCLAHFNVGVIQFADF